MWIEAKFVHDSTLLPCFWRTFFRWYHSENFWGSTFMKMYLGIWKLWVLSAVSVPFHTRGKTICCQPTWKLVCRMRQLRAFPMCGPGDGIDPLYPRHDDVQGDQRPFIFSFFFFLSFFTSMSFPDWIIIWRLNFSPWIYSQTSLIRTSLINVPHNPNTLHDNRF